MVCLLLIRLWSPGARDNSFNDLRYIWGGFAYLQDMMDHGIIQVQTSKTQPLGVFAQQMPYPCFVNDAWVQKLLSVSMWLVEEEGSITAIQFGSLWGVATHYHHIVELWSHQSLRPSRLPFGNFKMLRYLSNLPFFMSVLLVCCCLMLSLLTEEGTKVGNSSNNVNVNISQHSILKDEFNHESRVSNGK